MKPFGNAKHSDIHDGNRNDWVEWHGIKNDGHLQVIFNAITQWFPVLGALVMLGYCFQNLRRLRYLDNLYLETKTKP